LHRATLKLSHDESVFRGEVDNGAAAGKMRSLKTSGISNALESQNPRPGVCASRKARKVARPPESASGRGFFRCAGTLPRTERTPLMASTKNAVLLLATPEGWHPQRAHDVPPSFVSARFLTRGISLKSARTTALNFNLGHLQKGTYRGEWAVVIMSLQSWHKRPFCRPQTAAAKGGAQ